MGFQLILDTHLHTFNVKVVDVLICTVGRGMGVRSIPFTFSFIFYMLLFLKNVCWEPIPLPNSALLKQKHRCSLIFVYKKRN